MRTCLATSVSSPALDPTRSAENQPCYWAIPSGVSAAACGRHWTHSQDSPTIVPIPSGVGRIRARYLTARFPNPPVRPVRATFIAHGSRKRGLYRKLLFHQLHGLHRGQLAHSLVTFVPFSPPSSSGPWPCTRLSRVPTTMPHLTACGALEFRLGFPVSTLHPP